MPLIRAYLALLLSPLLTIQSSPYCDLEVSVKDAAGSPIAWSSVEISTEGFIRRGGTGASGLVRFCTVPADTVTVRVTATYYRDAQSLALVHEGADTHLDVSMVLISDSAPRPPVARVLQLGPEDSRVGCR